MHRKDAMTAKGKSFLIRREQCFSCRELTFRAVTGRPQDSAHFKFFWARNAIFHGLRALGVQSGEQILVPAYLCAAAIEPIEAYGAKVAFYAIGGDCGPDWTDLKSKIDGKTRGILAVHYFGFPCEVQRFRELCDQHNLFLIEDCAHVLKDTQGRRQLGDLGDFSVFSWRKFLPLFDGGELILNRPVQALPVHWRRENLLFTLRVVKNLMEQSAAKRRSSPLGVLTKAECRELPESDSASKGVSPEIPLAVDPNNPSFLPWMVNFPMSR